MPLKESDRKYTAFKANGRLFQFCRIPFGVKNGAHMFHRATHRIIAKENLCGAFPCVDEIAIAGCIQSEHDQNVKIF